VLPIALLGCVPFAITSMHQSCTSWFVSVTLAPRIGTVGQPVGGRATLVHSAASKFAFDDFFQLP
jgi:hypothetical protein